MRPKKIIGIFAILLLALPVAFATENKSLHLYYNATHYMCFEGNLTTNCANISFPNKVLSNISSVTGGLTFNRDSFIVGNGSAKGEGADKASRIEDESFSNLLMYNMTLFGAVNIQNDGDVISNIIQKLNNGPSGIGVIMRWDGRAGSRGSTCAYFNGGTLEVTDTTIDLEDGKNHSIACVINQTGATAYVYLYVDGIQKGSGTWAWTGDLADTDLHILGGTSGSFTPNGYAGPVIVLNGSFGSDYIYHMHNLTIGNHSNFIPGEPPPPDTTPPGITSYNMTSATGGAGCINWNTDKNNACATSDTTPTVYIETNENAYCAIGVSDLSYTHMGALRNCTAGGGTNTITCTLNPVDELTEETSFLYIGCKDLLGNEPLASTSGSLKVSLASGDLETGGRNSIEAGIQHALGSGYTVYTDQRIYARNSANQQAIGLFDKVVKMADRVWAFNFLTGSDAKVNMFNITPFLYVLEINTTVNSTNNTVYQFIMDTK